jgi:predicted nucleic acid-binding protein
LPDADDDMVLEVAVNSGADAIVTFNVRDIEGPSAQFDVAIVKPWQAVQTLELI